ncbi:MAG: hypothetical protein AAF447_19665 [Myxococcota bacterium]
MGTSDLAILGGSGRPAVVGLIGPPDSGKTSLLAYLYMWLLEHGTVAGWSFAGSWTLGGWESVVQYSRWTSEPPPSFPPHTSSAGRHPGILHLALRSQSNGRLRDMLLTDAPGEWFSQWARVPGSTASEGARWVIEKADALLLLVDTGALADGAKTTIETPETIEACFGWAIVAATRRSPLEVGAEPRLSNDPFLALRRSHGRH